MTKVMPGLRAVAALPLALLVLVLCWVGGAAGKSTTVSIARLLGRSDAANMHPSDDNIVVRSIQKARDLLRRCEKNPKIGKTRGKCSPIEAYIARCITVHNWRCLRCTYNLSKGITAPKSVCTQVRSPGLTSLRDGQAVCNPGFEPLAGFNRQDVRSCRPGHAKHGVGNFKCKLCHGRGYTPRIGATYCRICPAGFTLNKARTTCTPPPRKPAPKKPPPKKPPPPRPPPKRPPPPPACAGLTQDIFRLSSDIGAFTSNVLLSDSPLPVGKSCSDANNSPAGSPGCPYPYDPNTPNNTRDVEEPTLGHCDFSNTPVSAPCGTTGPAAVPYTHNAGQQCPANYTADYRGGSNDLETPGLSSNYIVRWTGGITIPVDGLYTFAVFGDDGFRLQIGGNVIINEAVFGGSSLGQNSIALTAGVTFFDFQYYQASGGSAAVVYWNWDGTAIDESPDVCIGRRRRLTGAGGGCFTSKGATFCTAGGAAFRAIPKSAFCATAPQPT